MASSDPLASPVTVDPIDQRVGRLFALVTEALSRATWALLNGDTELGHGVVADDRDIDDLTAEVADLVWARIGTQVSSVEELRHLVGILLLLPELERSADLAEHIAQRSLTNTGSDMTSVARGVVQRMSEVALEMWRSAADAYAERSAQGVVLDQADEELDILHDRLSNEVANGSMDPPVAAQVTLLARFYERLGYHAVNLARRIESLPG